MYASACNVGAEGNPSTRNLKYSNLHIVDCSIGLVLTSSRKGKDINAFVENSFFSALQRENCDYCYGENATKCSNGKGISLFVAGYQRSLDAKAFLSHVQFKNYNTQYSSHSQCRSNYALKPSNSSHEFIGSHHLENVTCSNCNALTGFDDPQQDEKGVPFGGKINYFIEDHTGQYTMVPSTMLAEKTTGCT